MAFILQIAVLIGLIKLLIETEKPLLCAGIYAGLTLLLGAIFGAPIIALLISTAIAFGYSFGWFWLLVRVGEGTLWWVVLIGGLLVPAVARFALASVVAS